MKARKVDLEVVNPSRGSSLTLYHKRSKDACLSRSWHHHPEVELVYIPTGRGRLFVADTVKPYTNGVLILMHSNIPHRSFDHGFEGEEYEEYVVQTAPQQLEKVAALFPEFEPIQRLLEASRHGVMLPLTVDHAGFKTLFDRLHQAGQAEQLLIFLDILHGLSKAPFEGIAATLSVQETPVSQERLEQVFDFISANFRKDISSQDAARLLHFTDASFCRFFQQHTRKTFKQVLNEFRTAHACKLLAYSTKSIEMIAYESGYGSHSFFNRMFKRDIGLTPLAYRKGWRKQG